MLEMVDIYNRYEYKRNLMEIFKVFVNCSFTDVYYINNDDNIGKFLKNVLDDKIRYSVI